MSRAKKNRIALAACAALLVCTPLAAQDWSNWQSPGWPQWLGPARNGVSNEKGAFAGSRVKEVWRVKGGQGFSGLAVVGGRVYTALVHGNGEFAVCLDAENGRELWRTRIGDTLYERQGGNGPRSTPSVVGDRLFTLSSRGQFFALDAQNGTVLWTRDLGEEFDAPAPGWGFCTSPLWENGRVLLETNGRRGAALAAFDAASGEIAWAAGSDKGSYSSPIAVDLGGRRQAVFFTAYGLVAVDPESGSALWKYPWTTSYDVNAATPIFVAPDAFFISSGYGKGAALVRVKKDGESFSAREVWQSKVMKNHFATSVYYEGYIYGFDNAILVCIEAQTGKEMWKARGYGKGTLIAADGHLLVLGERGKLALAKASPDGFAPLFTSQVLGNKCWTAPSLADGKIYVRDEREIACLQIIE